MSAPPSLATGPSSLATGPSIGIEALELFVEVLSQSERAPTAGEGFYDRLCEAVCRLARMRRAIIFRYDTASRRVRAAGAHGLDVQQLAGAHVTVESAPIAARALAEDRVVEIAGDIAGEFPEEHRAFAEAVAASRAADWRPTFENLSAATTVPVDDLVHHALVRWVSAGSEALLSIEPQALRDLFAARDREDWPAVAGIVDWLRAGS